MKFRKKPVVIEATQYRAWPPLPDGVEMVKDQETGEEYPAVVTLEGIMRVTSGDWIITGVNGERYPCKPDIFVKTYEPAE